MVTALTALSHDQHGTTVLPEVAKLGLQVVEWSAMGTHTATVALVKQGRLRSAQRQAVRDVAGRYLADPDSYLQTCSDGTVSKQAPFEPAESSEGSVEQVDVERARRRLRMACGAGEGERHCLSLRFRCHSAKD